MELIGSWVFSAAGNTYYDALDSLKEQLDEFFTTHGLRTGDGRRAYECIPTGATVESGEHDGYTWHEYNIGMLVIGPVREVGDKPERLERGGVRVMPATDWEQQP